MDPYFQDIYTKLKVEIRKYDEEDSEPLEKLKKIILATISNVNILKNHVLVNQFEDIRDEIDYFRNVQPLFVCEFIYYSLRHKHENDRFGICTDKALKNLCKRKINHIEQYFTFHHNFIAYYNSNESHLDEKYFKRNNQEFPFILDECMSLIDCSFITGYDLIIARVLAYRRFLEFIQSELKNHKPNNILPNINPSWEPHSEISWTSSKVALVELMYALIEAGCLNNGNCDINKLAELLEKAFNFKLNNYYHTFTEIKERKQAIQFLDSLKEALKKKIDEDDF